MIVADAGSTDGSVELLRDFASQPRDSGFTVQVVNVEPTGVAVSRNRLAELATGRVLCFLDNDSTLVDNDSLAWLDQHFDTAPDSTLVSFRVLSGDTDEPDPRAWVFRRPTAFASVKFRTFTFAGTGFAIRAEAFFAAGAFWEALPYAREEEDLALALLDQGASLEYNPAVTIRHFPSPIGRLSLAERRRVELLNGILVLRRRMPLPLAPIAILGRTFTMALKAFREGHDIGFVLSAFGQSFRRWRVDHLTRRPIRMRTIVRYLALHRRSQ